MSSPGSIAIACRRGALTRRARTLHCAAALAIAILTAIGRPGPLRAADRNADFLAALRERKWDDTAVEFLGWVEGSPLATPSFVKELPFQRAISAAAQARKARTQADRDRLLAGAAADFEAYAAADPGSATSLDAMRQVASLHAEQALAQLAAADRLPAQAAAARTQQRQSAGEHFAKAIAAAEQIRDQCAKGLADLPKPTAIQADEQAKARRDDLRSRQIEARFLLARLAFEAAALHEPKSDAHAEALAAASSQFGELVEQYRDSLVGATSRFYQGRCAQEQGEYEKALGCYQDLVRTPTADAEFRRWTARAHRRRAECLVAVDKRDEAIADCEEWLAASRPAEREQPDWLEIQFRLAEAYQAKAEGGGGEANQLRKKARTLLRDVAEHPNEFQPAARLALQSLAPAGEAKQPDEYKTFEEAFAAAKMSLELWNSSLLAAKLARENNPEAEGELQDEAHEHRQNALRLLEGAMDLADRRSPIDQLNAARYYLAVLYWEEKRIYEAATLATFLTEQYPDGEFAASAAKVALAALEQLSIEARAATAPDGGGASPFAARKLAQLAEFVAQRWPQSPDAASALNVLVQTALRENRLEEAQALLERLPAESRGAAELGLGAGLWTQYLRTTAGQRDAPSETAAALREQAGETLRRGFDSHRKNGQSSASAAVGALYLVQYLLAKGDAAAAVDVLEDKNAGPLSLVASGHSVAARPDFVLETYKSALRTYLSTEPPQRKQAAKMMTALEEFVAAQPGADAAKQLTDAYLGVGVQLQRQIKELTAYGQDEKAAHVAAAFGDVLDRVAARPDADSWRIRTWLAEANLQIGQGLSGEAAQSYLSRAKEAYDALLAAAEKDASYAPSAADVLGARVRLGECLAAQGDFEQALEQYAAILREKPNTLDLQQAAAEALEQWGVQKKDAAALDRAIRGDRPQQDGKNLIWGWLRLASMADAAQRRAAAAGAADPVAADRAARFEDLFFDARYHVVRSRYLAGTIASGAARQEHLRAALANIEQMTKLYPQLGGPKWKAAFTDLRKQIDQELAKP